MAIKLVQSAEEAEHNHYAVAPAVARCIDWPGTERKQPCDPLLFSQYAA